MLPRTSPALVATLMAQLSSTSRAAKYQRCSHNLFIWKQLPLPSPDMLELHLPFITSRVIELVYTAYDTTPLARDLGDAGPPDVDVTAA